MFLVKRPRCKLLFPSPVHRSWWFWNGVGRNGPILCPLTLWKSTFRIQIYQQHLVYQPRNQSELPAPKTACVAMISSELLENCQLRKLPTIFLLAEKIIAVWWSISFLWSLLINHRFNYFAASHFRRREMEWLATHCIIPKDHFARLFDNGIVLYQVIALIFHGTSTLVLLFNERLKVWHFFLQRMIQILQRLKNFRDQVTNLPLCGFWPYSRTVRLRAELNWPVLKGCSAFSTPWW